ncbi:glucosamine-6-phosphate deaminase [Gracilibacillus alcaliphilus]|uniref:glucosamine-6-phosphate deaminase n=1 Tax=Gracilibacillus alcaliphilus TaxID=1401441 RepID=UPI001956BE5C|nr:glucosamine-6-phosphate deaminase [Gracilibacillus alcaliphilus]MBM7675513.1 glucosamine-6-phosphate deaminase [Gracilibacillus alcaliphilus]
MELIKAKDYQDMSKKAAQFIIEKVKANPKAVLGLATGGTPVQTYANIVEEHQKNDTTYQGVTSFNLDEYIGLPVEDPNSYHYYMNKHLFSHIDIPDTQVFLPNGLAADLTEECSAYEDLIKQHGGIDLQLLGLGHNGHIGFNEPGTPFEQRTHVVDLAESTIKANARFFDKLEEVPRQAITAGIRTIMDSKEMLLIVSGEQKREALQHLLHGEVTTDFPASILQQHPHVTVIATEDAL